METNPSSIVGALGAGSGVDMVSLANQLAVAQFEPRQNRLNARSETLERQISLASSIRSSLSVFASSLGDRVRSGDLSAQPSITNSSVAKVTAPIGSTGRGSYSLEVSQLATSQTLSGPAYAGPDSEVGAGTLTIRFGATNNASFTENTDRPALNLTIDPGATLRDVAAAINAEGAGLTAYVSETTAGAQLVIKGEEGAANGFIVEATEDSGNPGLSNLAWSPGDAPARLISQSGDAAYTLDGLARTSATNRIENAAPGLSLELTGTNVGAPTNITFSSSTANITNFMQDLVAALNEIAGELASATDPLSGELSRDNGARNLVRQLSALGTEEILPNAPNGSPKTLAELGLAIERDGTFRLDTARLQEVLTRDPEGVTAMFTPGLFGVFATVDRISRNASVSSDPGSIAGSIARYNNQTRQIEDDLATLAEKQETLRANMVARFAAADRRASESQSTLTFLQAQIEVWNAQRSN